MKRFRTLAVMAVVASCGGVALSGAVLASAPKSPSTAPPATKPAQATHTIVAAVGEQANMKTLGKVLRAAGVADTLNGKGPYTLFAPSDEAWAKLPPGELDNLLKPENRERLANIVKFHVIADEVTASEVSAMKESSATLAGQTFRIENKDGKVRIGNDPKSMATVTKTDIRCSNGVIHVIDAVLMPR